MSAVFYVILRIGVTVPGLLLVRESPFAQDLTGTACLTVGVYLAVDGIVTINGLFH